MAIADNSENRRENTDRRQRPTRIWGAFPPAGMRMRARRCEEHARPYFVDRFATAWLVLVVFLIGLSMADAVLTICLVERGAAEINPLLSHYLHHSVFSFLAVKFILTAGGLPVLLLFGNWYVLGLRTKYLIPLFVALYVVLVVYQLWLFAGR
jgi:hypothetical protein